MPNGKSNFTVRLEPQHREVLRLLAAQYTRLRKRTMTEADVIRLLIEAAPVHIIPKRKHEYFV